MYYKKINVINGIILCLIYLVCLFFWTKQSITAKIDANNILPVLLAESFIDYTVVASVSSKFDSDWKDKKDSKSETSNTINCIRVL